MRNARGVEEREGARRSGWEDGMCGERAERALKSTEQQKMYREFKNDIRKIDCG